MALAFDYVDGFCHAQRGRLLRTTHDVFPSLLRYLRGCYATAGRIVAISNGKVAAEWEDADGVWQGGPLSNATFCLSLWDWMSALYARLKPDTALEKDSSGAIEVSIVDDLTVVLRRRDAVPVCTWMINTAPQYGVQLSIDEKWLTPSSLL